MVVTDCLFPNQQLQLSDNSNVLKYAISCSLFHNWLCSSVRETTTIKLANKTVIDCEHSQVHKHFIPIVVLVFFSFPHCISYCLMSYLSFLVLIHVSLMEQCWVKFTHNKSTGERKQSWCQRRRPVKRTVQWRKWEHRDDNKNASTSLTKRREKVT